ncbi:MAG: hypothetical protein QME64_04230 [bacterium]|nr:hypothetical protein [bacterium]
MRQINTGLIILILLISIGSVALAKEIAVQPWQKENLLLPVISTTYKTTANPAQLRLLTKYYAIEKAYTELQSFVVALPVDSTRTIQTVVEKHPQLAIAVDNLIRNKAIVSGFEYTSDSSAQITIALDAKFVVNLFQPYWKPEPVPKPKPEKKKIEQVKKEKAVQKTEEKTEETPKPEAKPIEPQPTPDVKQSEPAQKDSPTP